MNLLLVDASMRLVIALCGGLVFAGLVLAWVKLQLRK